MTVISREATTGSCTVHHGPEGAVRPGGPGEPGFATLDSSCWVTSRSPGFSLLSSTNASTVPRAAVLAWESGIARGSKATD